MSTGIFLMILSGYRFAEDKANFSISTDDPMVTGHDLQGDYDLVNNYWGLTEAHLIRAVSDILKSFCPSRIQSTLSPCSFFLF
jgi:hypothetical protein